MSYKPKISIVMISYNNKNFIAEAIETVVGQTLQPYELVLSDDGSTDGTWEVIETFVDKYPKIIKAKKNEKNLGIVANLMATFARSTGDWVVFCAGDDRFHPTMLEKQWRKLEINPECDFCYTNVRLIDAEGNELKDTVYHDNNKFPMREGNVNEYVVTREFFSNTTSLFRNELIRRSVFEEVGSYDTSLESYEDFDFKIRLTMVVKCVAITEVLTDYRVHGKSFSDSNPEKHLNALKIIYLKHKDSFEQFGLENDFYMRFVTEARFSCQYEDTKLKLIEEFSRDIIFDKFLSEYSKSEKFFTEEFKEKYQHKVFYYYLEHIDINIRKGEIFSAIKFWTRMVDCKWNKVILSRMASLKVLKGVLSRLFRFLNK